MIDLHSGLLFMFGVSRSVIEIIIVIVLAGNVEELGLPNGAWEQLDIGKDSSTGHTEISHDLHRYVLSAPI
ncbi:MAG: hypothetical protein WB661_13060 [Candidatus Bathyarchaeia archaeon]